MDLQPILIVNISILLLRSRKERFIVQPADVTYSLAYLDLARQLAALPVKGGQVAFTPAKHKVPPIASIVAAVWTKTWSSLATELEIKRLSCRFNANLVLDLGLRHTCRTFHFIFRLKHTSLFAWARTMKVFICQSCMSFSTLLC